jgi:hypothetical protein
MLKHKQHEAKDKTGRWNIMLLDQTVEYQNISYGEGSSYQLFWYFGCRKGRWVMNMGIFRSVRLSSLSLVLLLAGLAITQIGCTKASDVGAETQSNNGPKIEASIERIGKALQLKPDGTVSLNKTDPDYVSLDRGDAAFGKALIASLNARIQEGLLRMNQDFSVEWVGPLSACSECVGKGSCKTHWWGETCDVSISTTKEICEGLKAGKGAMIICNILPVVDLACDIIELVGRVPLENEICPCANLGRGSTFHVTWIDVAWFTCN